jgi:hypothetical protein
MSCSVVCVLGRGAEQERKQRVEQLEQALAETQQAKTAAEDSAATREKVRTSMMWWCVYTTDVVSPAVRSFVCNPGVRRFAHQQIDSQPDVLVVVCLGGGRRDSSCGSRTWSGSSLRRSRPRPPLSNAQPPALRCVCSQGARARVPAVRCACVMSPPRPDGRHIR